MPHENAVTDSNGTRMNVDVSASSAILTELFMPASFKMTSHASVHAVTQDMADLGAEKKLDLASLSARESNTLFLIVYHRAKFLQFS